MLRSVKDIEGFAIAATDGVLGHVRNLYFDDESWTVRYFVIETGTWRANRLTLISPMAMGIPDWTAKLIPASITQEQVRNGADIAETQSSEARRQNDRHLKSINAVMRYDVHATDGDIGHVQGMLVEEKTWAIRYIIVNTSNWWLGHCVLIAPEWVDDVLCSESTLMVALTRQSVRDAPEYNPKLPITREHETLLNAYFGHPGSCSAGSGLSKTTG